MRRSRSLPDSGGHLAQLIMIACLLGTPLLNAIPLPSLSSLSNQNSGIPHLSKRMEIKSLATLGVEAKPAQAAPDLVNAEHAAADLQKSSSAKGVNKAGAPGADVFPSFHTDHPSTLHDLTEAHDSHDTFFHIEPTKEQTVPKAGRASSFLGWLEKTNERLNKILDKKLENAQRQRDELRQLRVKQKIKKSEQLDVKDAAKSTIAQPRNVGSTAKDKKSPPIHESELQSHHFNSKDELENPLGESEKAVTKDKTTFQKSRFQRIFKKDFWSKLTVTKDFWSKLTDPSFWKGLFRFRKSATRGKAVAPVTANQVA